MVKKEEEKQSVNQNIDEIINDAMKNLKNMVETNTIMGTPVITKDGTTIIPISKVLVGFVCGGGEFSTSCKKQCEYPFAGGSGAGYTIVPTGFLIGKNGVFSFVAVEQNNLYSDLLVTVNGILKTIYKESNNNDKK